MRNPNLTVSKEPAPTGSEWYLVQDVRNEARLWIVEYNPQTDLLTCTCERAQCQHQAAVTDERSRVVNTYSNRSHGSQWRGVKPARTVTPEEAEAKRMAANIRDLYGRNEAWEYFMMSRQSGASIEALRTLHAELTAPAIAAEEVLTADWREDQADRLDMSRGQF